MAKDKSAADAGDGKGTDQAAAPAAPAPPRVRNAHTSSLVIAGKEATFFEAKPGQRYEVRTRAEGEDPRSVLSPELWAAAKDRPSVKAWIKAGLLVVEV